MNERIARLGATVGIAALMVPAAAAAHPGHGKAKGKSHKSHKSHPATYVFKGTLNADGSVHVTGGNHAVRKGDLVGKDVAFNLSAAKVSVADTNKDGVQDANDLQAADEVVIQARLPKGDPGSPPFAARKVVDETHPADEDTQAPPATEAPPAPAAG